MVPCYKHVLPPNPHSNQAYLLRETPSKVTLSNNQQFIKHILIIKHKIICQFQTINTTLSVYSSCS